MRKAEAPTRNLSTIAKLIRNARIISRTSFRTYRLTRAACEYGADQKWVELTALAHLVRQLNPTITMEIGVFRGGTISLWAQLMPARSTLVGIDSTLSMDVESRIRAKMKKEQGLHLIESNSHSPEAKAQARNILGNQRLDFLFIDGDHSYEGVKQDFEDYSSLVRPGGIVALHDIIPDHQTRYGIKTDADSGGVHQFWRENMSRFPHHEFIEDIDQDGRGIGVLRF